MLLFQIDAAFIKTDIKQHVRVGCKNCLNVLKIRYWYLKVASKCGAEYLSTIASVC